MKEHSETPYRVTFARLLGFLRPYKLSLIVSIVLAVASQGAQIGLVWVTKDVIDNAIAPHDAGKLWLYVWVIVGLGVLRAGFMAARRLISGKQALAVEMDLRQGLYARAQDQAVRAEKLGSPLPGDLQKTLQDKLRASRPKGLT